MKISALWFLFQGDKLLVNINHILVRVPATEELKDLELQPARKYFIGTWDQYACYAAQVSNDYNLPGGYAWQSLRQLLGQVEDKFFTLAGRGYHILHWDETQQFCGRCGTPNQDKKDELAKQCPSCGSVTYPRISPAVIVAITNGNQLLLARNQKFTSNYYGVLSGFVEPGENLEECVKREIKEEVGIEVHNITYFGSQPWPFPDSLMVGFTAEYLQGELAVDNQEIIEAKWFTSSNLPNMAPKSTIARSLIDWFINRSE